jgi:tagatose-1,6-bisphosphate aldolase
VQPIKKVEKKDARPKFPLEISKPVFQKIFSRQIRFAANSLTRGLYCRAMKESVVDELRIQVNRSLKFQGIRSLIKDLPLDLSKVDPAVRVAIDDFHTS